MDTTTDRQLRDPANPLYALMAYIEGYGLSQRTIAQLLGIHYQTVKAWLMAEHDVRLEDHVEARVRRLLELLSSAEQRGALPLTATGSARNTQLVEVLGGEVPIAPEST